MAGQPQTLGASSVGLPSDTFGMSTEDIIVLEQHFLSFTEANGGICKLDQLHDLLWHRCGEKGITRHEIEESLGTWSPILAVPMTLKQFVATVTEIKATKLAAGPRNLSVPEATQLFYLLSGQTDFIPTRVAVALCAVLDCESFQDNYLDYIGRDGFLSTLETDQVLSRRLAVKRGVIMRGGLSFVNTCAGESNGLNASQHSQFDLQGMDFPSAIPDDVETLEGWYRVNEENIEMVLNDAHALVKKEEEAKMDRQRQLHARGRRALLSYFAPEEVIPSSGATTSGSNVRSVVITSATAGEALQYFSDETTAQGLVGRVNDLKRLRKQRKEQHELGVGNDLMIQTPKEDDQLVSHDVTGSDEEHYNQSEGLSAENPLSSQPGGESPRGESSPTPSGHPSGRTMILNSDPDRRLFCTHNTEHGKRPISPANPSKSSAFAQVSDAGSSTSVGGPQLQEGSTGHGVTARLFPHSKKPAESIRSALNTRIGLSWLPAENSPMRQFNTMNSTLNSSVSAAQPRSGQGPDHSFGSDLYSSVSNQCTPVLGGLNPYSLGVKPDPFTHWREYQEFVPKPRKAKKKNTGILFYSPSENVQIEYNNYAQPMPKYKAPKSKPRVSASGLRLDLVSHTTELKRRAAKAKAVWKEQSLNAKVMEETGDVLGMTNTEHEASLLLLDARAKLQRSLHRGGGSTQK